MSQPGYADAVRSFDWGEVDCDLGWHDQEPLNLGRTIVDRHADGARVALQWVGKQGSKVVVTYRDLCLLSNRIANLLRALGVRRSKDLPT